MLIYKYKDIIKFFLHCYNNRIESYLTKNETIFPQLSNKRWENSIFFTVFEG